MKTSIDNNAIHNATWELKEARQTLGALSCSLTFEDRKTAYKALIKTADMLICRAMHTLDMDPRVHPNEKIALDSFVPNYPKDENEKVEYVCGSVVFDNFMDAKDHALRHPDENGQLTVYKRTTKKEIVV